MKVMEDERGDNGDELACVKETESQDADEMNQKVDSRDKEWFPKRGSDDQASVSYTAPTTLPLILWNYDSQTTRVDIETISVSTELHTISLWVAVSLPFSRTYVYVVCCLSML